jgi:hypothetical protein
MNQDKRLPIALAAALAFLAIGAAENATARPLDTGSHRHHSSDRTIYGRYGSWHSGHGGYHPYKYHPRPYSAYRRFR